ncbi:hypothetical protein Purlil1_6635 [Purpureocillium lilacinum]|uniref:Uncharacterized protein n=1 Tax=Purpureocillium lilacinum TaxID=33203 RepID=A0ABR0BZ84_PURLI|nr:hypothetical protein Purlil1_6635 [Purpureocillium lilacinum]
MLPTETRCGWDGPPKWRCNDLWLLASGRDASRRAVCVLGRRWWVVVMEGGKVGGGGWWEVTSPATHRLLWSLLVAIDFGDPEVAPTTTDVTIQQHARARALGQSENDAPATDSSEIAASKDKYGAGKPAQWAACAPRPQAARQWKTNKRCRVLGSWRRSYRRTAPRRVLLARMTGAGYEWRQRPRGHYRAGRVPKMPCCRASRHRHNTAKSIYGGILERLPPFDAIAKTRDMRNRDVTHAGDFVNPQRSTHARMKAPGAAAGRDTDLCPRARVIARLGPRRAGSSRPPPDLPRCPAVSPRQCGAQAREGEARHKCPAVRYPCALHPPRRREDMRLGVASVGSHQEWLFLLERRSARWWCPRKAKLNPTPMPTSINDDPLLQEKGSESKAAAADAHVFLSVLYEGGRRRGAVPYEHGVTCSSAWGHGRLPRSHGRLHGTVTVELGPPQQGLIDRSAWDARILARPTQTAVAMSWPMAAPENTRDQRPIIERPRREVSAPQHPPPSPAAAAAAAPAAALHCGASSCATWGATSTTRPDDGTAAPRSLAPPVKEGRLAATGPALTLALPGCIGPWARPKEPRVAGELQPPEELPAKAWTLWALHWFADGPRLGVNSCRGPLSLEASTAPPRPLGPATPRAPQLPSTTLALPRAAAPPLGSTGGLADDGVGALVNGAPRVRQPFVRRTDGTYPHDLRVLRCPAPPGSGSAAGWLPSDPPSPLGWLAARPPTRPRNKTPRLVHRSPLSLSSPSTSPILSFLLTVGSPLKNAL